MVSRSGLRLSAASSVRSLPAGAGRVAPGHRCRERQRCAAPAPAETRRPGAPLPAPVCPLHACRTGEDRDRAVARLPARPYAASATAPRRRGRGLGFNMRDEPGNAEPGAADAVSLTGQERAERDHAGLHDRSDRLGAGLSPRGRGNRSQSRKYRRAQRSIPARAGEPARRAGRPSSRWVYPRAGGGTATYSDPVQSIEGLSPRGRGNLSMRLVYTTFASRSPVRAGSVGGFSPV